MRMPSDDLLQRLREQYPAGTRVELVKMEDAQAPLVGTRGTVYAVDDAADICVNWDDGSGLSVAYGEDIVKKIIVV